jgi:hypothetical protein
MGELKRFTLLMHNLLRLCTVTHPMKRSRIKIDIIFVEEINLLLKWKILKQQWTLSLKYVQ